MYPGLCPGPRLVARGDPFAPLRSADSLARLARFLSGNYTGDDAGTSLRDHLIWSRSDVATNSQVVDILLNSADPRGVDPVRLDSWTIHGGLNLHNAMRFGSLNVPPVANAGADQTVTDTGLDGFELVTVDGSSSSDADGSIVSYQWREGETVLASEAVASVLFAVGTHVVTLSVTDDRGATATDSLTITVQPGNTAPVAANVSASPSRGPWSTILPSSGQMSPPATSIATFSPPAAVPVGIDAWPA